MKKVFKVKINYKSGKTEHLYCTKFKATNTSCSWESVGRKKPLKIGIDDIESVYQQKWMPLWFFKIFYFLRFW